MKRLLTHIPEVRKWGGNLHLVDSGAGRCCQAPSACRPWALRSQHITHVSPHDHKRAAARVTERCTRFPPKVYLFLWVSPIVMKSFPRSPTLVSSQVPLPMWMFHVSTPKPIIDKEFETAMNGFSQFWFILLGVRIELSPVSTWKPQIGVMLARVE